MTNEGECVDNVSFVCYTIVVCCYTHCISLSERNVYSSTLRQTLTFKINCFRISLHLFLLKKEMLQDGVAYQPFFKAGYESFYNVFNKSFISGCLGVLINQLYLNIRLLYS